VRDDKLCANCGAEEGTVDHPFIGDLTHPEEEGTLVCDECYDDLANELEQIMAQRKKNDLYRAAHPTIWVTVRGKKV